MAPHSTTLAWKILWTEEPGRLQSMGSQRVGHNWATSLSLFTFMHCRRKWQPTPVFLSGESQGRGEPGGLPSMGSHRVGHNWSNLAAAAAAASMDPTYKMYVALLHQLWQPQMSQTLPDVLEGVVQKYPCLRTTALVSEELVLSADLPLLASLRLYSQYLAGGFKSVQGRIASPSWSRTQHGSVLRAKTNHEVQGQKDSK